jgi:hypothetical protein
VIGELSIVIYAALDHGIKEDDQRKLSAELENLLDLMATYAGKIKSFIS